MTIKIYGSLVSRATRNLWMLEELGVDYEWIDLDWIKQENRSPDYLKINPAGQVPTLIDGDVTLSESLGINLYLAQKFGGGVLWPDDDAGQARCIQWSVWAAGELEPAVYPRVYEFVFKKAEDRDDALIAKLAERTVPLLDLVEGALSASAYLVGDAFSVADLNVAGVMEYLDRSDFDMAQWPKTVAWYETTYGRAANQKVQDERAPVAEAMLKRIVEHSQSEG
jgi:glutathione S-transferase